MTEPTTRVGGGANRHHPRVVTAILAAAVGAGCAACGAHGAVVGARTAGAGVAGATTSYYDATTVSVSTTVEGDTSASPQLPAYLPSAAAPANQIVTATARRPVRAAVEGNTVIARLPGGSADVTVVGPQVPRRYTAAVQSGHRSQDLPVPASFIASITVRSGSVRVAPTSFTVESEDGAVHRPQVTGVSGGPLPAELGRGQHLNLRLVTSLVPGNGGVRWTPLGLAPLVTWTYVLEVD